MAFRTGDGLEVNGILVVDAGGNIQSVPSVAINQAKSAMDTTNLKLEVNGNASIRGANALYFGVTTNNFNSWKGKIWNNNTTTMYVNAQEFNVNNAGYGSLTFLKAHASGVDGTSFRDLDDTAYYVNPSISASKIVGLNIHGGANNNTNDAVLYVEKTSNADWGIRINGTGSATEYGLKVDLSGAHSYAAQFKNNTAEYSRIGTDFMQHNAGVRSPKVIAGTSSVALTSNGPLAVYDTGNPYISFHTGTARTAYMQELSGRFYFGEVPYTESVGSFRSPVFYDSDNAAYYLDPSSTGTSLNVAGNIIVPGYAQIAGVELSGGDTVSLSGAANNQWVTVANFTGSRKADIIEIYDSESSRHNYVKIEAGWSYGQGSIQILNAVRHGNRTINQVRMLYNTADRTYGTGKLQVYMTNWNTSYSLKIKQLGFGRSGWGRATIPTSVENGLPSGYTVHETTAMEVNEDPNGTFGTTGRAVVGQGIDVFHGSPIKFHTTSGDGISTERGFIDAQEGGHLRLATSGGENIIFQDGGLGGTTNLTLLGTGEMVKEATERFTIKSHSNGWEGGMRMYAQNGSTIFQIHPDNNGHMYVDQTWRFSNNTLASGHGRLSHHTGHLVGGYNNVGSSGGKSSPIYTIGSSYNPTDTSISGMYGIGYTTYNSTLMNTALAGATDWGMYVAANGTGRVWLDGHNGNISSAGSVYASTFYDSGDTNYFVHPGDTTHSAKFRQHVSIGDGNNLSNTGTWGARLNLSDSVHSKIEISQDAQSITSMWNVHTGQDYATFGTSSNHHLELRTSGTTRFKLDKDGGTTNTGNLVVTSGDVQSNRYDDEGGTFLFKSGSGSGRTRHLNLADTTADPANVTDSNNPTGISWGQRSDNNGYYMLGLKGAYNNGYSTYSRLAVAWHTGVEIGGNPSYGGTRFFSDSPYVTTTEIMSVGKGDSHVRVINNLYAKAFYDIDSSSYYLNPASTSFLDSISVKVGSENTGGANSSTVGLIMRHGGSSYNNNTWAHKFHKYDHGGGVPLYLSETIGTGAWSGMQRWGSYSGDNYKNAFFSALKVVGSVDADAFYDRNNTSYFLNPSAQAGNSLKTIGDWRQDSGTWSGEVAGKIQFHSNSWYLQYSSEMVFRNASGLNTMTTSNTGVMTVNESSRAPIFYDSNDTNYYGNFAGTSIMGAIDFNTAVASSSAGGHIGRNYAYDTLELRGHGAEMMIGSKSSDIHINYRYCNNDATGNQTPTNWYWRNGTSSSYSNHYWGQGQASLSLRAPIFYDSDDTAYYVDPNSESRLSTLRTASHLCVGGFTNSSPSGLSTSGRITFGTLSSDATSNYSIGTTLENYGGNYNKLDLAFHTGIRLGAHPNYGGVRFYADQSMATEIFAVGKSGNYVQAANSMRAPIFYDSNDTAYYSDNSSTSIFSTVKTIALAPKVAQIDYTGVDNGTFSFTNPSGGSANYVNRGGRVLTSNASGWHQDGEDPTISIVDSHTGTDINSAGIGLYMHNEQSTNSAYSPGILFGAKSTSGSYNSMYGAIYGRKTTNNTGVDTNWNSGELHFFSVGSGYITSTPDLKLANHGEVHVRSNVRAPVFYDSNNTAYFLDASSTGDSLTTAGTIHIGPSGHLGIGDISHPKIAYPGPGAAWSGSGTTTGQIVIDLPGTLANYDMLYMEIDIYEYSAQNGTKLIIGGHNWNSGGTGNTTTTMWHNVGCKVIGDMSKAVRFGWRDDNGTKRRCIAIGDTTSSWSYGTVHVSKCSGATSFYNDAIDYTGNWEVNQTTSTSYFTPIPNTNFNSTAEKTLKTHGRMQAYGYQGNGNVGGTGEASWHPSGVYSNGTNWLYGQIVMNNNYISGCRHLQFGADANEIHILRRNNANNSEIRTHGTGAAGLLVRNSSDQFRFQLYGDGSNYGFLDGVWASWDLQKTTNGAMYMNGNTSYYMRLEDSSTSINVAGAIVAAGNVTAYSDRRVKEDIIPITNSLDKVQELNGVTFRRTDLADKSKMYAGLIAQDVEAVLPEAVEGNSMKRVDYNAVIGLLVESIKELKAEVDELKEKLENK
jgi:hypothetical protein